MKFLIKYSEREILWMDNPASGIPVGQNPLGHGSYLAKHLDRTTLSKLLRIAEKWPSESNGVSALEHGSSIAHELSAIEGRFPGIWLNGEIEVSDRFATANQLPKNKFAISEWLQRFQIKSMPHSSIH